MEENVLFPLFIFTVGNDGKCRNASGFFIIIFIAIVTMLFDFVSMSRRVGVLKIAGAARHAHHIEPAPTRQTSTYPTDTHTPYPAIIQTKKYRTGALDRCLRERVLSCY